jgi:hypothetical protein
MARTETPLHDSLDEPSCLIVAALADGEPVDAKGLRNALDDPAVRDYLVDLVSLRQAVGHITAPPTSHRRERRSLWSAVGWVSAAAAILVSMMAGYVAGHQTSQPLPAPAVETVLTIENTSAPPRPTRVIPLRPGVNWTEKTGGQ